MSGFTDLICDHGDGAILPGVVNCHVHLEFSALAGKVAPQARWEDWLEATLAAYGALAPGEVEAGMARAMEALWQRRHGIGGGGDQHRGLLAAPGIRPAGLPPVL